MSQTLQQWLSEKPFTLCLSSGFFSFYAHLGLLAALEESGLKPAKLSGSSAGALVAAAWASGMSCDEMRALFFSLKREDFWDPALGLGLLKGDRFRALLREHFPVACMEQAAYPLAVSVYDWRRRQTLSFSKGLLAELVSASCAVPGLFQPVSYRGYSLLDGGIKDRPGLLGVAPDERVFYHHIASRSPWRRKGDPALKVPERHNMASLQIDGLVRSGPRRMALGPIAYQQALEASRRALSQAPDNRVTLQWKQQVETL